ncbi:ankyrin repeat-containing domain protein [Scenedesmus sp. NREL 46B-D3]|nr:ankyrin repeat-containing domain protein [Scenedesmus sp. NREL 46B-D3]
MGPPPPQLPQQHPQPSGSSGLQITGSAGSGPYSRPSSGSKGWKTVCLLVDAVRSKDDSQLQANLAYCTGGLHGLNDLHPTIDKTPLHEAVSLGCVSMVRMLLAAGSDPNLGPQKQGGPLLQAAGVGASEVVQLLLGAGARVDATDAQGRTALHHACGGGHVEAARLLISRGAALTARTLDGETPMVRCPGVGRAPVFVQ